MKILATQNKCPPNKLGRFKIYPNESWCFYKVEHYHTKATNEHCNRLFYHVFNQIVSVNYIGRLLANIYIYKLKGTLIEVKFEDKPYTKKKFILNYLNF